LLVTQMNTLKDTVDTEKTNANIRESIAFINNLHLQIETELEARAQDPQNSTEPHISIPGDEKLIQKKPQEQIDEMISRGELSEVNIYSRIRNRYMMLKERVNQAIVADASKKNTPEYESYQRLLQRVEPLLKDKESIKQNHSDIQALTGIMEREIVKIDGTKPLVLRTDQRVGDVIQADADETAPRSEPVPSVEAQSSAPPVIEEPAPASTTEGLPTLMLTDKERVSVALTDEYVEPDMKVIGQEDWKQVLPDTTAIPSDTEIGKGYVEPNMDIIGQEDWKQVSSNEKNDSIEQAPTVKLFGMNIPKAGPEGVHGARSFGKALEIPKHRFSAMDSENAKLTIAKLDEAISLTRSVPESGLTSEQVTQLEVLTNEIGMPENYITYSKILRATEVSLDKGAATTASEKLPAAVMLVSKEKNSRKSGALRTLGLATLLSVWTTAAGDGELRNADGVLIDTAPSVASASENSGATGQSSKAVESDTSPTADSLPAPEATPVPPAEPRTPGTPNGPASVVSPEDSPAVRVVESLEDGPSVIEQQQWNGINQMQNNAQVERPAPKVAYTFTGERNSRGDVIDTVSEAALEMWKRQPEMISSKVTTSQFLAKMWSTIAAIEADPVRNTSVLRDMEITSFSNDIDLVNKGQTIDLRRLFVEMNK